METQTTLIVSFAQNPALAEALAGKSVGDKGDCEVNYTIKEITSEGAVLNIEAIVPEGYEVVDPEEANNPSALSPAMGTGTGAADMTLPTAMASMIQKKKE